MNSERYKGYNSPIATRLRDIMTVRNTKQIELAKVLGVTRQSIGQYRDGSSVPPTDKIVMLAEYYNVSVDYMVGKSVVKSADISITQICEYTGLSESELKLLPLFAGLVRAIEER